MKSNTGKRSRRKGAAGEREFINTVYALTGGQVKLSRNLEQSREGGDDTETENLSIEIKRYKTVSQYQLKAWWQQCYQNAEQKGKNPVLAFRADKQPWEVMLRPGNHFPPDDLRGCVRMDVALFCYYLTERVSDHAT